MCKGTTIAGIEEGCRIAKDAGIGVHLTIMVGYPWETRDDAMRTYDLAKKLLDKGLADMLQATVVIAYPGTPLYTQAVENDWLRFKPGEWEKFDMTRPVFKFPDMEPTDVMKICDDIYKAFMTPQFMMRQVMEIRNMDDFLFLFKAGQAVMGHILDFKRDKK